MTVRRPFRSAILAVLVSLLACPLLHAQSASDAGEVLTAEVLLDRWVHALGGREKLERIRITYLKTRYEGTAGTGVVEEWSSHRIERRQHSQLDTGEELTVYDGAKGWSRRNGRVRSLSPEENAGQRTAAFLGSLSHLLPGRFPARVEYLGEDDSHQNHILRVSPEGGQPTVFYLDKKSYLPTKNRQQLTSAVLEIQFEEWKELDGIKVPGRLRLTTDTGYEATETITEIRHNGPWGSDLFARPPEGPADFRFASGGSSARIPMVLDGGHILVRGRLNGSAPAWLALDTGASGSLLDLDFARSLGLTLRGRPQVTGAGGTVPGSYAPGVDLEIAGVELENQTFTVMPLGFLPPVRGELVRGILGYDFFSRFVVEIDYGAGEILAHELRSYVYRGPGAVVPFTLHRNQPYILAAITLPGGSRLEGEYVVDLGSGNTLMLASDYAATHSMLDRLEKTVEVPAAGVGGDFRLRIGRLEAVQVGPFTVPRPLALFPPGEITAPGKAGNLGGRFLRRFRVIFDYSRERMILEHTARLAEPEEFDMSGLRLAAAQPPSDHVLVAHILENSPAADAGIRPGDWLLTVDGQPAGAVGVSRLREMFREEGREFELEVKTKSETRRVRLKLRRLI